MPFVSLVTDIDTTHLYLPLILLLYIYALDA